MMTLLEAIQARHSVRRYQHRALPPQVVEALQTEIDECNRQGQLHIQLVMNEPKAFSFLPTYGAFSGVEHYLVMAGPKAGDLDDRVGYYGERLVLLAQQLGLGTCWAGLTYRKVKGTYQLAEGEKIACMISLGYPDDPGRVIRRKRVEEVSNVSDATPDWFRRGVEAAIKGPSAIHQQKFYFEYLGEEGGCPRVRASRSFSMIGYTQMDLGIAKLHFEIGAGRENFEWEG
jgi:nitroreductase